MASLVIFGLAVAGGVIIIGRLQENTFSFGNDSSSSIDIKQKSLDYQREWGYLPKQNQIPTSVHSYNRIIPRLKGGEGPTDPESAADIYAAAAGQKMKELAADAFNRSDHVIAVPHGQTRNPLFTPLSAQGTGDMASYPFSYFESKDNMDTIDTRQDIFKDPFPSTFPGPSGDIYAPAAVPEGLQNPWSMGGRYNQEMNAYREPGLLSAPKKVNYTPSFFPRSAHPWTRRVESARY